MKNTVLAVLLLAASASAGLPTSCEAPTGPPTSTYGICAFPRSDAAAASTAAIASYLKNNCGCNTVQGTAIVPAGVITGLSCGGPGPDLPTNGVSGWIIRSSFNPKGCPPGSKCP
ncbi:hypothetical protein BP6252_05896 [Coleophoma cylindrospora]|uniref:Uncharacterized protein n=1 Tax=Coleophoma cylindrospora TaxID=1849047 RepID=A0A3D8RLI0_9HELO|nr:hypothetical protein BP6252_05896 [Coleophoma cylindrospora]